MNTFLTLYKFELKKIFQKKLTVIFLFLGLALIFGSFFLRIVGGYYVNGERVCSQYERLIRKREYAAEYDGREIDNELLQKMSDAWYAYGKTDDIISVLDEADKYWYIAYFADDALDLSFDTIFEGWKADINELYQRRHIALETEMEQIRLTEAEKQFWREKEADVKKPIIFRLCDAYGDQLTNIPAIGLIMLIVITTALSGVFCDEHARKTDHLIFASAKGKTTLYKAKLLAGMTFAVSAGLAAIFLSMLAAFSIYGTGGADAAFQFIYGRCSLPINCLQGVLIAYGAIMTAFVFYSVFIMLVSEAVKSSVGGLTIGASLVIASMAISVPDRYRVLVQIFEALPTRYISPSSIFSPLTYPFFGARILPAIAVPVIYLIVGIIIWIAGKKLYSGFQVSGR